MKQGMPHPDAKRAYLRYLHQRVIKAHKDGRGSDVVALLGLVSALKTDEWNEAKRLYEDLPLWIRATLLPPAG